MRSLKATLIAAAMISAACPASGADNDKRLATMTPAQFAAKADILDDALETAATIRTRPGYEEKRPLIGLSPTDVFLRAFVSKTTGRVAYQVYVIAHYYALVWADFSEANYATATGPQSTRLLQITRLRTPCTHGRPCARSETVAFAIDERLLREAAAAYVPGQVRPWPFKIKARTGDDQVLFVSAAEIGGLLMAVDAYRAGHHLQAS